MDDDQFAHGGNDGGIVTLALFIASPPVERGEEGGGEDRPYAAKLAQVAGSQLETIFGGEDLVNRPLL